MKFGMFGKNIQVEIISDSEQFVLQDTINAWLKVHKNDTIIDIQMTESNDAYTASIFYVI